jgi:endonuclease/exonuclease/phosphatase family metal-dependent hydrolase
MQSSRATLRRRPLRLRAAALAALAATGCALASSGAAPPAPARCRDAARVAWLVPASSPELDRWCAAVGAPALEPAPGAGEGVADSVAVVSWNTHVGGGDLAALVGDLRTGRLTGGRPVRDFVLLLQEVYRADPAIPDDIPAGSAPARVEEAQPDGERAGVVSAARALGLALVYVPSMRNGAPGSGADEDRGNALLSTLPLRDPGAIELPFEAQRRVAVAATLSARTAEGEPWMLRVASVHLDTRATGSRILASVGVGRLHQARALEAALSPALPTLVAGDLNTWAPRFLEPALGFLEERFPHSPPAPDEPTFDIGWGMGRTLDHLFFRAPEGWSVHYRRLPERYGSDHYPLLGWVRPPHRSVSAD